MHCYILTVLIVTDQCSPQGSDFNKLLGTEGTGSVLFHCYKLLIRAKSWSNAAINSLDVFLSICLCILTCVF